MLGSFGSAVGVRMLVYLALRNAITILCRRLFP